MITDISFIDSLIVSLFSITVVFGTLIVIAVIIGGIKLLSTDDKKSEGENVQTQETVVKNEVIETMEAKDDNEELVAVIIAAILASLGVNSQDIHIKNIKKIPQNLNP